VTHTPTLVPQAPPREPPGTSELRRVWADPPGLRGFLTNVNHKAIGRRYIATAFTFFALAGLLAATMRLQLSRPDNKLLGPDLYNQIFTMHGTTMMFLFAVPVMEGFGVFLVPLMLGTRNVAFPRLNLLSYYNYLIGGLLIWLAFLLSTGPDVGWFAYVPLSGPEYGPGKRADIWAQMITFTEISALAVAVELIATILKQRAPGMSLDRMPLFVWAMLVQSFMVLFAMPAVMLGSGFLAMDRLVATHFFNVAEGGDAILWQHIFWFFAHPEVYIIFIPATGMVSEIIGTFSRRPVFGYVGMILSLISTAFIGFGVWVHHMFATGLPQQGQSFFTAASIMIAVPAGIQVFGWIATIWGGRPRLASPMLFALGFLGVFVLGGLSGVMLASIPVNLQVHDTYFVVAHFHYVLIGGAVFPLLGAICYWFPKLTGHLMDERLAKISCGIIFLGFNLTFFPMHKLGLDGMPRRVYTYSADTGWGSLNLLAGIGALTLTTGLLVYLAAAIRGWRRTAAVPANPWEASGLEWATTSPPEPYNFEHLPTVRGRSPLWEMPADPLVVTGMATDQREVLATSTLDARPDHRVLLPSSSIWPLLTSIGVAVTFIGVIFRAWMLPVGAVLCYAALFGWLRADDGRKQTPFPKQP
jgi:cytochrome c oxidase subunit I+III